MSEPGDQDLHRTQVGQPNFDTPSGHFSGAYPPAGYPSGGYPVPPKRNGWLAPVIVALVFALIGVIGIFVWLVVHEESKSSDSAAASTTSPTQVVTVTPQEPTVTEAPPTVTQTTVTVTPETSAPAPSSGGWYAQIGAFNEYDNAVNTRNANPGSQILSGSAVGLSTNYVVVFSASSQSAADAICSNYPSGGCYVKSGG
ncbi:MAG: hypothetical protein QM658_10485 [Gordonia sp. (in: high G+C Gram-positive bacteria)]